MIFPDYDTFRDVAAVGDRLILSTRTAVGGVQERRLVVIDPNGPVGQQLVWAGEDTGALQITIASDLAFVSSLDRGVRTYDISDPAKPRWLGDIPLTGDAIRTVVRETDLFILEAGRQVNSVNQRQPGRGLRRVVTGPLD